MRVFLKFFFFLSFFYLLNCLYRYINPFVIANIVPSVFLISIYYIFFIKYKTNLIDIAILSIYYVIYDYIIGNIPFVSITAFLLCVLLIEYFKKRTDNDILLYHYLISGGLFFVIKISLEWALFDITIHIIDILTQLLIFSISATSFYISNLLKILNTIFHHLLCHGQLLYVRLNGLFRVVDTYLTNHLPQSCFLCHPNPCM